MHIGVYGVGGRVPFHGLLHGGRRAKASRNGANLPSTGMVTIGGGGGKGGVVFWKDDLETINVVFYSLQSVSKICTHPNWHSTKDPHPK